jgi:type IV pilus assembly protein PilX
MIARTEGIFGRERGMVLVTALLLLIVVTLIALAMFRSVGLDQKMAGNLREKQRALNAAESAEQYAEYWLANGGSAGTAVTACSGAPVAASAASTSTPICTLPPTNPATLPWSTGVYYLATPVGSNSMNITSTPALGSFYNYPEYYISYIGQTAGGLGKIYQIDAMAYGASPDTAAVVETTYIVQTSVQDLGSNQ